MSSTAAFYQKSIFSFLNPFRNTSGYLNLWDIFRFIFRQLFFFHKIKVTEKSNFFCQILSNFAKSKISSECK